MAAAIKQVKAAQSGSSTTTLALTLDAAPTSGNLLVFAMGGDKNTGALTLSGFTQLYSTLGASTSLYIWYKISAGTETTINPSWASSSSAGNMGYYMELEDTAVSGSNWVVSGQASTTYSDSTTNSCSSNTTGTLTDDGLALACFSIDSSQSWSSGTAYTQSYTSQYAGTGGGGRGAIFVGKKSVSAGGTTETTFSYTGTADQVAGAVGVFAKVAASVTVTPGVLALVDTQYAPVIQHKLDVPTKALTLTTFAPSVNLVVTVPVVTLVLTTYAPSLLTIVPTVALAITSYAPVIKHQITVPVATLTTTTYAPQLPNVYTPALIALTLSSYAPVLPIITGTLALTLTTFAPTAGTNVSVTVPTTALVLTGYAPQVNLVVIPAKLALALSLLAPVTGKGYVPTTKALTLATFAPVVAHKLDVPVALLILTKYAPVMGLGVVPPKLSVLLATLIPVITLSSHQTVTPGLKTLTLTGYEPALGMTIAPVVPDTAVLRLSGYEPLMAGRSIRVWRSAWGNPGAYAETWGNLPPKEYRPPT